MRKKPYQKEAPETIVEMFDTIAHSYDKTNAILSFNLHRYWNRYLIKKVVNPQRPSDYLDLCCGTGEIAFSYLKQQVPSCRTILLDFCEGMLNCAKKNSLQTIDSKHQLTFLKADAQSIPLLDHSIDCTTIAYGIRNVQNPLQCFRETYRVLRPGGVFGILELTQPKNAFVRFGHRYYLKVVLPLLVRLFTRNRAAYEYLCSSIQEFKKPAELTKMLEQVGFQNIQTISLTCGTATILIAEKKI